MLRLLRPVGLLTLVVAARAVYADQVDDLVEPLIRDGKAVSISLAVVKDGKTLKVKSYGLANVELRVAATPNTVYQLASLTKQFTAAAINLLVEDGKLSLDDNLGKLWAELPQAWHPVTVRQLLGHTSGIKSYTALPDTARLWPIDHTPAEIIKILSGYPADFAPGEKYLYNNTGYFLLGNLVQKLSGKSYGDFLSERIFTPLRMTGSLNSVPGLLIPNKAYGYAYRGGSLQVVTSASPTWSLGAGAICSSVNDLIRWTEGFFGGRLMKPDSLRQMLTTGAINDGKSTRYGHGWVISALKGKPAAVHTGARPGFSAFVGRVLDEKLTVIVLSNTEGFDVNGLAVQVGGLYLAKP